MWRLWGRGELCTGFYWGNLRERDHWEDPDVDGSIILKWIFGKWEGLKTGWSWFRIGTDGGPLWIQWWTFGLHKVRGISWLAAEPISFSRRTLLHGVSKYYFKLINKRCLKASPPIILQSLQGRTMFRLHFQRSLACLSSSTPWYNFSRQIIIFFHRGLIKGTLELAANSQYGQRIFFMKETFPTLCFPSQIFFSWPHSKPCKFAEISSYTLHPHSV